MHESGQRLAALGETWKASFRQWLRRAVAVSGHSVLALFFSSRMLTRNLPAFVLPAASIMQRSALTGVQQVV